MKKILMLIALSLLASPPTFAKPAKVTKKAVVSQLMEAAESGNLKKVKSLADKVDLNSQGEQKLTALMRAAVNGQEVVVDFLLSKKVDLELKNENGDTALAMAVGNEQNAIAEKLIRHGARVDVGCGENSETLLMCATRTNAMNLIKIILKKAPSEAAKKNNKGETALDLAKEFGTAQTVKLLQTKK
jgi:ankyrin repeat protein